jgi:hypothetical protein
MPVCHEPSLTVSTEAAKAAKAPISSLLSRQGADDRGRHEVALEEVEINVPHLGSWWLTSVRPTSEKI